jgi:toxin ParE1/3/4
VTERKSEFHPSAQSELNHAATYYESRVPGLGAEFMDEVQRVVTLICQFPDIGPVIWETRRRALVRRFPFALIYRIIGDDTVRVLAVMHLRKRPSYWHGRR